MRNQVLLAVCAAFATIAVSVPADAAKRKKSPRAVTANVTVSSAAHAGSYYYRGTGTHALRDRSRAFFGSPVRGREFFESIRSASE